MSDPSLSEEELIQLKLLREEEIDALVEQGLLGTEQRWESQLLTGFTFSFPEMRLVLKTGDNYPVRPLSFRVENIGLPRLVVDDLRIELRQIALADSKTNKLEGWNAREENNSYGHFNFAMTSLHLATRTVESLAAYRKALKSRTKPNKESHNRRMFNDKTGLDLKRFTGDALIKDILGMTPQAICENLPPEFRILHIESVIRSDLAESFLI